MKTLEYLEEHELIVINDVLEDKDGKVISEDVTCATSTRLPILKLVPDDDDDTRRVA